jgi:hypothetical protein
VDLQPVPPTSSTHPPPARARASGWVPQPSPVRRAQLELTGIDSLAAAMLGGTPRGSTAIPPNTAPPSVPGSTAIRIRGVSEGVPQTLEGSRQPSPTDFPRQSAPHHSDPEAGESTAGGLQTGTNGHHPPESKCVIEDEGHVVISPRRTDRESPVYARGRSSNPTPASRKWRVDGEKAGLSRGGSQRGSPLPDPEASSSGGQKLKRLVKRAAVQGAVSNGRQPEAFSASKQRVPAASGVASGRSLLEDAGHPSSSRSKGMVGVESTLQVLSPNPSKLTNRKPNSTAGTRKPIEGISRATKQTLNVANGTPQTASEMPAGAAGVAELGRVGNEPASSGAQSTPLDFQGPVGAAGEGTVETELR